MSFPRYPEYKDSGVEWLGEVPEHWEVVRLNTIATCNDEVLLESTPEDYKIEYVEISGVQAGQGIVETAALPFGNAPSRARRVVRDGDVLVSTVRTYLRAIAQVKCPPENMIASTGFAVLRPRRIDSGFLGYACHAEGFVSEVIARSVGVSYPAINASELTRLPLPLPTTPEQTAIATFLDRETAKIDALVAEQEKLIALLQEKRQAVISHAVTKGLDPNVPMKDSGVEWLGEVPGHWEPKRLKFLASNIKAGPFGSALTKDMYVGSGYRVYGQEQVIPGDFAIGDYYIDEAKFAELSQYETRTDDVLISCVGTFGKIAVVPADAAPGIINPRLIRLRTAKDVMPLFLAEVLRSTVTFEQFSVLSRGGTMDVINIGTLSDIWIALPPIAEQSAILNEITTQMARFDALMAQAQSAITLLQERRAALISAAVTGKIDVRGAVPEAA